MSIATALTALNSDVVNARNKIVEMGGAVTPNGGTSQLSADIATIPQGGGESGVTKMTGTFTPATTARGFSIQTGLTNLQEIVVLADIADIANLPVDCVFKICAMKHGLSNFSSETISGYLLRNDINAVYCYRTSSATNVAGTAAIFHANGDVFANIRAGGFPAGQTYTWTAYGWEEPT